MNASSEMVVEDVEFMLDTGCVDAEVIIARLRKTGQATNMIQLQRLLYRAGRHDLLKRFVLPSQLGLEDRRHSKWR